jgi:hypothetical protein
MQVACRVKNTRIHPAAERVYPQGGSAGATTSPATNFEAIPVGVGRHH